MTRSRIIIGGAGIAVAAAVGLLIGGPLAWQSLLALLLIWVVPGALFVEALLGRTEAAPEPLERVALSAGAGVALAVVTALALGYLPGPLARWQTLAGYTLLVGGLALWALRPPLAPAQPAPGWRPLLTPAVRRQALVALGLILLLGTFLRFTNLGYAEFQGDEARAALRAAAVIQGYEDVLFLHKKGPTEILLPTALYSLTGRLTETMARAPFALANVLGLLAAFVLGWRLAGPVAGGAAALLLALDGYFVGFARIVQYQSVIFLTSALVFLIALRLARDPRRPARWLVLAALLLATGLLSHYEGALVAPAALWLLGLWWWHSRPSLAETARILAPALLVGGVVLAAFYIPFVLHPNFTATYTYLAERRIGGQFPYNNLEDFFLRTTVYSSTYYVLTIVGLLALALLRLFWESRRRAVALAGGVLLLLTLTGTAMNPAWATVGTLDLTVIPFTLVLLAAFLLATSAETRALLIWFGLPMLAAFFFTLKPRTHVYTFFTPWILLAATAVAVGWAWLRRRSTPRVALTVGGGVALATAILFGAYIYLIFVQNQPEYLRHWAEVRSPLYWTVYEEPDDKALFGFPLRMGWKTVGELYRTGELAGPYETNEKEAWVPDWYTRSARRCQGDARYFFLIDNLEPEGAGERAALEQWLADSWHPYGTVTVNGDPRMRIFERNEFPAREPRTFDATEMERAFDQQNADWAFHLGDPSVVPPIPNPVDFTVGNGIHLLGYALNSNSVRPGETLELTLFWRAEQWQLEPYTVFNQIIEPNVAIYGQRDSQPVCGSLPTNRWDPGQIVTDHHSIAIRPDASVGTFPLIIGMYQADRGLRLDVQDGSGTPIGNQIELAQITIEPPR